MLLMLLYIREMCYLFSFCFVLFCYNFVVVVVDFFLFFSQCCRTLYTKAVLCVGMSSRS